MLQAVEILKAAKDDYENDFANENTQETVKSTNDEIQRVINNFNEELNKITEFVKNACGEEAKRNTRIYLAIIFAFLLLITLIFFYFFGVKYSFLFTIGILVISYFLSVLSLKEWTSTKLPERLFEFEKDRIYKRFSIIKNTLKQ